MKEPELIDLDGDFRVNFYRTVLGATQTTQSTTQTTQSVQLTDLDKAVIEIITNNPAITQSGIASELGWAVNRVKYYTKKLSDKGVLEHKGNSRRGTWEVHLKNGQIKK